MKVDQIGILKNRNKYFIEGNHQQIQEKIDKWGEKFYKMDYQNQLRSVVWISRGKYIKYRNVNYSKTIC
jgi:hypothetical protein